MTRRQINIILTAVSVVIGFSLAEAQTTCVYDYVPRAGRGPAPDGSGRRVITVNLHYSWGAQAPDKIWNGTIEALRQFNEQTDQYGNKSPYYFELDQGHSKGYPADITIVQTPLPEGIAADAPGSWTGGPAQVRIDPGIMDDFHNEWHVMGLIGHEIGHTSGLASGPSGGSIVAPIRKAVDPNTGLMSWMTQTPGVTQEDIAAMNRAFNNQGCTIDPNSQQWTAVPVDEGFGSTGGSEEEYSGGDPYYSCWTTWAVTYYLARDQYGNWYVYDMSYDYVIRYDCYPLYD